MNAETGAPAITASEARSLINTNVRDSALLADVTVRVWGGERTDKKIMDKAKQDAGAVGNVGRAVKNLLAGADANLKACKSAYAAVRMAHYRLTLPFVSDPTADRMSGSRLLPNVLFNRYLEAMSKARNSAHQALDAFCDSYEARVAKAKANLAGLADADYPHVEAVRRMFHVSFDFTPVPMGADFVNLPDAMMKKLADNLDRRQQVAVESARNAMWNEVRERITHFAGKLTDPEARFKATTVEGVTELADLLPGWAIDGDPRALEVAADIARMAGVLDPKALRKNPSVRTDAAAQAQAVVDKLSAWGL